MFVRPILLLIVGLYFILIRSYRPLCLDLIGPSIHLCSIFYSPGCFLLRLVTWQQGMVASLALRLLPFFVFLCLLQTASIAYIYQRLLPSCTILNKTFKTRNLNLCAPLFLCAHSLNIVCNMPIGLLCMYVSSILVIC